MTLAASSARLAPSRSKKIEIANPAKRVGVKKMNKKRATANNPQGYSRSELVGILGKALAAPKPATPPATPPAKSCDHCGAAVHYLDAYPATLAGSGIACRPCYDSKVETRMTDADRRGAIGAAFGGSSRR